ncbi:MAG TPA: hypothetical protein VGE02_10980 [Gemmatimonadales bacterium]
MRPLAIFILLVGTVAARQARALTRDTARVAMPDSVHRFPVVEGSNLEGRRFTLPRDFEGALNVVLVAFQREQQDDVDSWMPFLKAMTNGRDDLRVYELPTLGRGYRLMRPFIDGGMRRGIPDAAVRAATITLYIDKGSFRGALGVPGEDCIYLLLVDREGRVWWRGEGAFDERAAGELARRAGSPVGTGRGTSGG